MTHLLSKSSQVIDDLCAVRNENKTMIVKMGDDVTLHTDAEIEANDQILWTFEGQGARIAEIKEGTRETFDGADGKFTDRLVLDETGSLTIRNIEIRHAGVYIIQLKKCHMIRWPLYKRFTVMVNGEHLLSFSIIMIMVLHHILFFSSGNSAWKANGSDSFQILFRSFQSSMCACWWFL